MELIKIKGNTKIHIRVISVKRRMESMSHPSCFSLYDYDGTDDLILPLCGIRIPSTNWECVDNDQNVTCKSCLRILNSKSIKPKFIFEIPQTVKLLLENEIEETKFLFPSMYRDGFIMAIEDVLTLMNKREDGDWIQQILYPII